MTISIDKYDVLLHALSFLVSVTFVYLLYKIKRNRLNTYYVYAPKFAFSLSLIILLSLIVFTNLKYWPISFFVIFLVLIVANLLVISIRMEDDGIVLCRGILNKKIKIDISDIRSISYCVSLFSESLVLQFELYTKQKYEIDSSIEGIDLFLGRVREKNKEIQIQDSNKFGKYIRIIESVLSVVIIYVSVVFFVSKTKINF